jgi:hypothetical protein
VKPQVTKKPNEMKEQQQKTKQKFKLFPSLTFSPENSYIRVKLHFKATPDVLLIFISAEALFYLNLHFYQKSV